MTIAIKSAHTNWTATYLFCSSRKYWVYGSLEYRVTKNLAVGRADWHLRANSFVILYLIAALVAGAIQKSGVHGQPKWLTIHLLLLGATTNAIITWSDHFVTSLLWARMHNRRRQMVITVLLNIGIIGVLVSVSKHFNWLITGFAALIGAIMILYLRGITILVKQSLNRRFVGVIRFYQSAAFFILVGICLGVVDAFKNDKDPWQPRITLAHLHANLLGWVGLTIVGTLVTLWPTVLRTPMHPKAIPSAITGLKFLLVGVSGAIIASLLDQRIILAMSIAIYLTGAVFSLFPAALLLKTRQPDRPSSWMILTGSIGLAFLLIGDFVIAISHHSSAKILVAIEGHLVLIFSLWLFPILLGALTYLLPVVLGRGPTSNRELEKIMGRGWQLRLLLLSLASIFLLLPSKFHNVGYVLIGLSLGAFLVLALNAMYRSRVHA